MIQIGKYSPASARCPAQIQREFYGQGYIVKDEPAFLSQPDRVCYVPELSDTLYTRRDFLRICNEQPELAQICFDCVNWEHPETWVEEQFLFGEWAECPACGKWDDAESNKACLFCGASAAEKP